MVHRLRITKPIFPVLRCSPFYWGNGKKQTHLTNWKTRTTLKLLVLPEQS
jgi:hypothetical protein